MSGEKTPAAVAAIAALGDPTRRALYRYILAHGTPVSRDQAAAALGVAHHIARFHLDRLHDAGLLHVEYKRPPGRGGPGAGHPAKLYRPAATEFAVSVPQRRYDIAGLVLARAVAGAIKDSTTATQVLNGAASEAGRALGKQAKPQRGLLHRQQTALAAAIDTLDACGYAPRPDADRYVLGNCPFRAVAQAEPDVACQLNLSLVSGLLDEVGARAATARLDPAHGRCCVTIDA